MEITRATNALRGTIRTVEEDIADILQSGNYYCTEEIARELTAIKNGIDHLKLDGTLLASPEWQESFDPNSTGAAIAGANSVLDQTAARLYDYKSQLGAVSMGQKEENDVRELHQWAITSLKGIQDSLAPYAYTATDRIKQFGDHVGVTDRYTGYRNNLTRSSKDPFKMETSWMDKGRTTGFMNPVTRSHTTLGFQETSARPTLLKSNWGSVQPDNIGSLTKEVRFSNTLPPVTVNKGYRTLDSLYPRSNTFCAPGVRPGGGPNGSDHVNGIRFLNSMNATLAARPGEKSQEMMTTLASASGPRAMSLQEQAGINTTFPGRSEYMQRYASPDGGSAISDFLINPTPNMKIHGRPLGKARHDPTNTEYQTRYDWPDGSKICSLPWMRK